MFVPTAYCCKSAPSLCVQRSRLSGPPKETMIASTCVVVAVTIVRSESLVALPCGPASSPNTGIPSRFKSYLPMPLYVSVGRPREKLYLHSHAPGHTVQSAGGFPPTLD